MGILKITQRLLAKKEINKPFDEPQKCAICSNDYNHLVGVTVLSGSSKANEEVSRIHRISNTGIEHSGPVLSGEIDTFTRFRGLNVVLHYLCENRHKTAHEYGTHKGMTFLRQLDLGIEENDL